MVIAIVAAPRVSVKVNKHYLTTVDQAKEKIISL